MLVPVLNRYDHLNENVQPGFFFCLLDDIICRRKIEFTPTSGHRPFSLFTNKQNFSILKNRSASTLTVPSSLYRLLPSTQGMHIRKKTLLLLNLSLCFPPHLGKSRLAETIIHYPARLYNVKSALAPRAFCQRRSAPTQGTATGSPAARSGADFWLDSVKYV